MAMPALFHVKFSSMASQSSTSVLAVVQEETRGCLFTFTLQQVIQGSATKLTRTHNSFICWTEFVQPVIQKGWRVWQLGESKQMRFYPLKHQECMLDLGMSRSALNDYY